MLKFLIKRHNESAPVKGGTRFSYTRKQRATFGEIDPVPVRFLQLVGKRYPLKAASKVEKTKTNKKQTNKQKTNKKKEENNNNQKRTLKKRKKKRRSRRRRNLFLSDRTYLGA